jgi:AAHS family 4-hydroxybenzoate transporter-like MFS transporter
MGSQDPGLADRFLDADPTVEPRHSRLVVLALCGLLAMLDGADAQSIAIAAPMIVRDLGLGAGAMGLIFSLSLAGAAAGAFMGGLLADRIGARRVLASSALLFGGWQYATGHATSLEALLCCRLLAGLGLGAALPALLGLAAAGAAATRRARILGIVSACYPLGGLAGGIGNGWLIQHRGWREIFFVGGILPVVLAGLVLLLVNEPPPPVASRSRRAPLVSTVLADPILRQRTVLLCCIFAGVYASILATVIWTPTLLVQNGFKAGSGGFLLAWHAVGSLVSFAFGGLMFERFGRSLLHAGLLGGAVSVIGLGSALGSFWMAAMFMMLIGSCLSFAAAAAMAIAGELYPPETRAGGLGLAMAASRAGQIVPPYLMGLGLAAGLSGRAVMHAGALLPALAGCAAILLGRSLRHSANGKSPAAQDRA